MEYEKYSVLMSLYYREKPEYLIKSLNSIMNQTVMPDEVVLVKDGKLTNELEDVLKQYKDNRLLKIISLEKNVGLGKALNIGLKECKNNIIARMDTDDISKQDRCEKQLKEFYNNKDIDILSSNVYEFNDNINNIIAIKKLPIEHDEIIKYAKSRNPFNHPSVMYKKNVVIKAGGYIHFELFEDYYLWARMIKNGAICKNIEEPLVYMRANESMYKRRGGFNYLKCIIKFKWHLKEIGFFTFNNFLVSTLTQGLVAILPNKLRIVIYKIFLRDTKSQHTNL